MIALAQPAALLTGLLLVPAVLAWRHAGARRRQLDVLAGGSLELRRRVSGGRRRRAWLLLGAMGVTVLAIARPTWGNEEVPLSRRGIDVAIALDISRSMNATDIKPTRAEAAASGLAEMLSAMTGDRVGLVTFAGTAFQRAPLTLDLEVVSQLVRQAQDETPLVQRGTDLASALEGAITLLDAEDGAATRVVVLVSDGEHVGRDLEFAIRRAQDTGVAVYTVAAGTEEGADLPSSDPREVSEATRLDAATLRRIADETGGDFRGLESVAGLAVQFSRLRQSDFSDAVAERPIERFQWFLGVAIALLGASTVIAESAPSSARPWPRWRPRRRATALAAGASVLLAACGGTVAYEQVRDGNAHYEAGRYDEALTAYGRASTAAPEDPVIAYDTGNALHQLRRFEEAVVASRAAAAGATETALLQSATYALGAHAFERGDLRAARDAYVEVLRRDPLDDDARHNLELVLLAQRSAEQAAAQPPVPPADGGDSGEGSEGPDGGPNPTVEPGGAATPPGGESTPEAGAETPPGAGAPGGGGSGDGAGGTQGSGPSEATGTATSGGSGGGEGAGGTGTEQGTALTLEEAQAALAEALAGLGEDVTVEEALAILDQLRSVNALVPLEGQGARGTLPDR